LNKKQKCPKPCPNGDECGTATCYEDSPCEVQGQSAPGFVKQDTTKMYCGSDYSEATSCGSPCPLGGGIGECPDGQSCWAEVECNPWAAADTTTTQLTSVEVTVEIDD